MSGINIKKPNSIIKRLNIDICLIFNSCSFPFHKTRLIKGDNIKKGNGIPTIPCSRRGIGKIAGPAKNEKSKRINTGITFILCTLQVLYNPMTKNIFRAEHRVNPAVNRYWDLVPNAPNSLTILEKWL